MALLAHGHARPASNPTNITWINMRKFASGMLRKRGRRSRWSRYVCAEVWNERAFAYTAI
jgi:hypothetical protein